MQNAIRCDFCGVDYKTTPPLVSIIMHKCCQRNCEILVILPKLAIENKQYFQAYTGTKLQQGGAKEYHFCGVDLLVKSDKCRSFNLI